MNILVTGGTGHVGGRVVEEVVKRRARVRVLARQQPPVGTFQAEVDVVIGDLLDPVSVERAMQGMDKLFLINGVVADELTQALIAFGMARRLELKHVTYLSVFKAEQFRDVPHFAAKLAMEGALREFGMPFTILRPGYYIQNDVKLKDVLTRQKVYPAPFGAAAICAVDMRDIAEAAAISLTEEGHEGQTYDLVGPSMITGQGNAAIWSKMLNKVITFPSRHDFDQLEEQIRATDPGWSAFDRRMMLQGYFERGFASTDTEVARVTKLLGHAPRSYEAFARETAEVWTCLRN